VTVRRVHTLLGLTLLLPFLAWIVTALVFYLKPGYAGAYEFLQPATYGLAEEVSAPADTAWREARFVRTILGTHLLVRTAGGWEQRDPATRLRRPAPGPDGVRLLVGDAIARNPSRYGEIASVAGDTVVTTTGVTITLDWDRLSLTQRGPDTDRIDLLYRIHYLQWTGVPALDRVLGPAGLALLLALCLLGLRLAVRPGRS
jgi:hypothetical protein